MKRRSLKPESLVVALLCCMTGAVLIIQFFGVGFGLPRQYHPDEYYIIIESFNTIKLLSGEPLTATAYVLGIRWLYCASYLALFVVGSLFSLFNSFAEFYNLFYAYGKPWVNAASPWFYLPPRLISFGFYAGSAGLVYALTKRLIGPDKVAPDNAQFRLLSQRQKRAGPGGDANTPIALLVTFSALLLPAGYLYSHYGTRESALAFFCLLIPYHAFFHFDPKSVRSALIGAVLVGTATGIKENGAIFIGIYLWALGRACLRKEIPVRKAIFTAALCGIAALAVFYLLNVHMFLGHALKTPFNKVMINREPSENMYRTGATYMSNWHAYPMAFIHEFTAPGLVLLLIGAVYSWITIAKLRPLILAIIGSYLVLTFARGSGLKCDRFIMNIFLPFYVAGAVGFAHILRDAGRLRLLWLLPVLFAVFNGRELVSIFLSFNGHDTRAIAAQWLEHGLPENSVVARELINTPVVDTVRYELAREEWMLGRYSLESLQKEGIDYLIFSERFTTGWVHGKRVVDNYREFMPHVLKTFDTEWKPRLNDFHSPRIYVAGIRRVDTLDAVH